MNPICLITLITTALLTHNTNFGAQTSTKKHTLPFTLFSINTGKIGIITKYQDKNRTLYLQAIPQKHRFSYYEINERTPSTSSKTVLFKSLGYSITIHKNDAFIDFLVLYEQSFKQLQEVMKQKRRLPQRPYLLRIMQ
jgi:hypothetical protein